MRPQYIKRYIAVFLLTALIMCVSAEEAGGGATPVSQFSKTYIKSVLLYMDKTEAGGGARPAPVQSREERTLNTGALYLMIKVNVSDADAKLYKDSVIYIFRLNSYQKPSDISSLEPVTNFSVKQDTGFEFSVQLQQKNFSDLNNGEIFCKYVLGVSTPSGYAPISDSHYIDDINNFANANDVPREAKTKKGLQLQMPGEAKLLGVEHTVINIFLNDIITLKKSDNTETFIYKGDSFYFNAAVLAEYDRKVKFLNDQNVIVTAVLLLRPPSDASDPNGIESILIHKNSVITGSSFFYGINTSDADGAKYFEAIMSFLADRYFTEGSKNGRISNVILGDEIGRSSEFNNCGVMTAEEYITDYMRALRIADTAVRSRFGGARVYIPLDKYFASKPEPDSNYINKELIDLICEYSVKEGNFPWNIAFHAYNEDINKAAFWRETSPANDFDTPIITMKNIEVLVNYINTEKGAYLKDSKKRKIMISDLGFSSGDNSNEEKNLQAAAFCYAYNKIRSIPEIESFIYHRHVDSSGESANFGLWQEKNGEPSEKKKLYDVFKFMETDRESDVTEFAKTIIGISDWTEKIADYTPPAPKYVITEAAGEKVSGKTTKEFITKFNNADLSGFLGTLNVRTPGIKVYDGDSDYKNVSLLSIGVQNPVAGDWFGVFKNYDVSSPLDLKANKYILVRFRIDTEHTDVTKIPFRIILEGYETAPQQGSTNLSAQNTGIIKEGNAPASDVTAKQKHIFEGVAEVAPNKDVELYFQIDKWAENKAITGLRLLINPTAETGGSDETEEEEYYSEPVVKDDFTLFINSIVIAQNAKLSPLRILLNVILILVGLAVALYLALFIRAQVINYQRRKRRALKRQRELERRRNEQNRMLRLPPGSNPQNRRGPNPPPPQNRNRPR